MIKVSELYKEFKLSRKQQKENEILNKQANASRTVNSQIVPLFCMRAFLLFFNQAANIYLNAAEAVEALPKQLTSIGTAGFSGGGYYYVGSQTGNTDFDKKAIYKKVDWATKIQ